MLIELARVGIGIGFKVFLFFFFNGIFKCYFEFLMLHWFWFGFLGLIVCDVY